jgi:hypothetical protein
VRGNNIIEDESPRGWVCINEWLAHFDTTAQSIKKANDAQYLWRDKRGACFQ